jgi:transcriptional regulator with GAF, ATPase, and Fis domain
MSQMLELPAEARHLEAFHDLLPTLARALDVRDVFRRLSEVADRIVPHDEANLALLTEDGSRFRMFASTADGPPELLCRDDRCMLRDLSQPRLFTPGAGFTRGLQSGVSAPVRIEDRTVGVFALLSQRADAYTTGELALVQRLADYVAVALAHQRLAEAARAAAVERERAGNLESSVELLREIAGVLDIRTVFPRISEIVSKILPHDRLTMAFYDRDEVVIEAASNDEFAEFTRVKLAGAKKLEPEFRVIDDLTREPLAVVEPADLQARFVAAGYRSALSVHTAVRDQELGLAFWSKRVGAFGPGDFPVARTVMDHVALAVSHEQLADAARQVAEARGRAEHLEARVQRLAEELDSRSGYGRVVGQSEEWKSVLRKATQVAATDTTVLLTGESGTGKEVVARFIHRASARKNGPFVALNCAALPEQLLESELFGYERGAFTGAQQSKPGQIELAAGGVLFLDEVSEMSSSAQAKFLRVLQEREFQRLGGTRPQKANVRVIAATNRDLKKAMERGDFREDLYYRLQVFDIALAPLRDRRADILPLAEAFLDEIGRSFGRPPAGLTHDAKDALLQHEWRGNVRELRNTLERAAILCEGGLITAQHLSLRVSDERPAGSPTTDLRIVERETIQAVMREMGGNKVKAAKRLGLSRTQLYVRLRKYGLDQGSQPPPSDR